MDELSVTDLNRMIQAIQHECGIRIREIKLEALQEYNLIKSEIITTKEKQLSIDLKGKLKEIKIQQDKEESNINQDFKLKVNEVKENIVNMVFDNLRQIVQEKEASVDLINQITSKVKKGSFYVFCFGRDRESIENALKKTNISYEIKQLPDEALGGIILCSRDGKEIWDNTFETRINILLEQKMDEINKELFN